MNFQQPLLQSFFSIK